MLFHHSVSPLHHPLWALGARRLQHYVTLQGRQSSVQHAAEPMQRWRQNLARLYARRILELAAASAATHRVVAEMEQAVAVDRPSDWHNWERKDWTDELLASIGSTRLDRLWSATARIAALTTLAAPFGILLPLSYVSETAKGWSWDYALWGIEKAGPTFVKLVQWATTRQDLFSPEFCSYFGKLRDETVGHPWKDTERILQEDLGDSVDDILDLQPDPIGSGCIAQVYRGTLKRPSGKYPSGTDVAVKVQHPDIWKKVCTDFYIMVKAAKFLEGIPRLNLQFLSLVDTVQQFRDIMLPQLDLTLEAKHLNRFNRDFKDNEHVGFPYPLGDLTTTRVLVETFIDGTPIMEYLDAPEPVRKQLANLGLTTTLQMIFLYDFIHGDLHPGNILVTELGGGKGCKLQLLDCGLVVEMGPEQHENVVKILGAFTRRKGREAGQLMVDASSNVQASELDVELFVAGIEQIVINDEDNNFVECVGDYIADICFLACQRKVKLEASFINAALAVEIMEGIATALNPDLIVSKEALPLILKAEMMHRIQSLGRSATKIPLFGGDK